MAGGRDGVGENGRFDGMGTDVPSLSVKSATMFTHNNCATEFQKYHIIISEGFK